MNLLQRRFIELDFNNSTSLTAGHIAFSATESIEDKINNVRDFIGSVANVASLPAATADNQNQFAIVDNPGPNFEDGIYENKNGSSWTKVLNAETASDIKVSNAAGSGNIQGALDSFLFDQIIWEWDGNDTLTRTNGKVSSITTVISANATFPTGATRITTINRTNNKVSSIVIDIASLGLSRTITIGRDANGNVTTTAIT